MAVIGDTRGLTRGSHQKVTVACDFGVSEKCRHVWEKEWRTVLRDRGRREDGKDICLYCSRHGFRGENNPNFRHKIREDFLEVIDTESKAYLLGWIASDGALQPGSMTLMLSAKDRVTLKRLAALLGEIPLTSKDEVSQQGFTVNRKKLVEDVCRHLGVDPGAKSRNVRFPELDTEELTWAFVRGLFDGDGSINSAEKKSTPECSIASSSQHMREGVRSLGIPCRVSEAKVEFQGVNALDFLAKIYDNAALFLGRKHDRYYDWASWVPSLGGPGNSGRERGKFWWGRTHPDGVPPFKSRASDSGYDLTLIGEHKTLREGLTLYRTGVRVTPVHGWYFDLVPRSSLIKTGYMLANSVGVIDRSYTGEIYVPLVKIDPEAPDLEMPARVVQLVPRPVIHLEMVEVDELQETERGDGGFGSTGGHGLGPGGKDPRDC